MMFTVLPYSNVFLKKREEDIHLKLQMVEGDAEGEIEGWCKYFRGKVLLSLMAVLRFFWLEKK